MIKSINQNTIFDRLELCWGHLENWKTLEVVQESKKWLEKTNSVFTPTTLIAYKGRSATGMMEFVPQKLLRKLGLCPCRVDTKSNEIVERYLLGREFENHLFISCLFVNKENQGKGIGRALLDHFLNSRVLKNHDGATVYVRPRDAGWDSYIHWPAGSEEFYRKAGFTIEETLDNPTGYMLCYRRKQ